MWLVWSGEWDCEASPVKFETLREMQEWLENWNTTPIQYLHFYTEIPSYWLTNILNLK